METNLISAPANHAAPAPSAGSATRDLRAELADAIAARRAADARAAEAKRIADRADAAKCDASVIVEHLKQKIDVAGATAISEHAERLAAAFKAGEPLPDAPAALPETDSAALTAALARLSALNAAAFSLAGEYNKAQAEASVSAAACRDIVDAVLTADARRIANEWIAATRLCWKLQDRLTGAARVGNGNGMLLPHKLQADILDEIDRPKHAIAQNALMIERHNYDAHLDRLAAEQEKLWLDYGCRLMLDPDATFDDEATQ